MRKILPILLLFACSSNEKIEPPPSPQMEDEKAKRMVYEGIIKTKYGEGPIELYLTEVQTGLIKRIIEMKKSDAYTNKEKAAQLTH